jgi:hypothetical protein
MPNAVTWIVDFLLVDGYCDATVILPDMKT